MRFPPRKLSCFLVPQNPWEALLPYFCAIKDGCHRAGNGQETKFFKVREKSGNFINSRVWEK